MAHTLQSAIPWLINTKANICKTCAGYSGFSKVSGCSCGYSAHYQPRLSSHAYTL